jgi:hypothetical protein
MNVAPVRWLVTAREHTAAVAEDDREALGERDDCGLSSDVEDL